MHAILGHAPCTTQGCNLYGVTPLHVRHSGLQATPGNTHDRMPCLSGFHALCHPGPPLWATYLTGPCAVRLSGPPPAGHMPLRAMRRVCTTLGCILYRVSFPTHMPLRAMFDAPLRAACIGVSFPRPLTGHAPLWAQAHALWATWSSGLPVAHAHASLGNLQLRGTCASLGHLQLRHTPLWATCRSGLPAAQAYLQLRPTCSSGLPAAQAHAYLGYLQLRPTCSSCTRLSGHRFHPGQGYTGPTNQCL